MFPPRFPASLFLNLVIAGFNTDIEFEGTVYHVQTEDKGSPSRELMTLVYDGGTILASKRVSYEDLAPFNFDEKKLEERLGRQHKLVCAAVGAGRLNELKEMTAKNAVGRAKARQDRVELDPDLAPTPKPAQPLPAATPIAFRQAVPVPVRTKSDTLSRQPLNLSIVDVPLIAEVIPDAPEPVVEVVRVIEEEILSAEAVEVVSELSGKERPANQKLKLELLGETKFKGGDRQTVSLIICRGTERKVVPDAQIMVKVLGSSFRPVIFHARSDSNGLARIHLHVPQFSAGRAALLVRAIAGGEEVELRRLVSPG